jgi:hypothetical protein
MKDKYWIELYFEFRVYCIRQLKLLYSFTDVGIQ